MEANRPDVLTEALAAGTAIAVIAPARIASEPTGDPRDTPLYPRASSSRTVRDLSGLWRVRLDPGGVGERDRWFDGLTDSLAIRCRAAG